MTYDQRAKAAAFRRLHDSCFVIPNPWDAGSARLLAALGYQALATTSAGFAFALGRNDGPDLVSRAETLENARQIVAATALPVSADLQNGFGDAPEEAARTITLAADAGLVGGSIEDATGDSDTPVYARSHAAERIAAAVEAARALDFPFTLTARAENFLYGRRDLDDTIARLQAFETAGADVLYAPGLRDLDAIRTLCQSLSKPVNVVMGLGKGVALTVDDLAGAGVKRISLGSALSRAALGALLRAAREVAEQGTFTFAEEAASFAELAPFFEDGES